MNGKKKIASPISWERTDKISTLSDVFKHTNKLVKWKTPQFGCVLVWKQVQISLSLSLSFSLDSHIFNTVLTKSKAKSHISTTSTTATSLKDLRFDGGVGGRDRSRITHLVLCASRSPSSFLVHGGNSRTLKTTCFACGLSDPSSPHPVIILRFWYQLIIVLKKINK